MIVIPAIDLKEGRVVRLKQGLMDQETSYSDDPGAMASKWADMGAELIHVVDLDGAFAKKPMNEPAIKAIIAAIDIPIEVGGGIRDMQTISRYLEMGVQRVILGTVAHNNPALVEEACKEFPGRVVVGIDAKDGKVAVEGWAEVTEIDSSELVKKYEGMGARAIIFTDIARDGMLTGPAIESTRTLAEAVSIPIIASGGVATIDDIKELLPLEKSGIEGVITGRAIYQGTLDLREAIQLTK